MEVIEASDGTEAWRLAQERLPDLVVLDVMMPGMSGWEVCRKIRQDAALAHTGVLMLTGIGVSLNETTSPLFGADDYVDKPFDFETLDAKVVAVLGRRAAQREAVPRPVAAGGAAHTPGTPNGVNGVAKAATTKTKGARRAPQGSKGRVTKQEKKADKANKKGTGIMAAKKKAKKAKKTAKKTAKKAKRK
jgi:DNA-binding response OmpR family regulator